MPLLFEGLLLVVGLYWFITSTTSLPLWKGMSLGGGLIPAIASGIMIVLLIFRIISRFRESKINKEYFKESFKDFDLRAMIPIAIGIGVLIGIKLIGMILSLTIMLFCWLKFLSKYSWLKSLLITVCVMCVLYGIFRAWLVVPLPKGMLGLI